MNSNNPSDNSLLVLILQQIENITQEINRTVSLLTQAVKALGTNTVEAKKLIQNIIDILSNDKDGMRQQLTTVSDIIKTYNIEKRKSWWSLRNSIIIALVMLISSLITYFFTH